MRYERIQEGTFLERPNRFIAYVEIEGVKETVHVKNTGRCAELLVPGARVCVQKSDNPQRKTQWDLIAVWKGERLINMDSQIPNALVREWLEETEEGRAFLPGITYLKPEYAFGNSRIDLYAEAGERKILIEVKGVTLEEGGVVRFPDAPSERAVKHMEELSAAVKEGWEAVVFFVVQMEGVDFFTPNMDTHPAFGEALKKAAAAGVRVTAWDCHVEQESISIRREVPVVLGERILYEIRKPLVDWYRKNRRELPWRENPDAYRVWVSEIMLQQTRVEAVKPYYERFLAALPDVKALAEAPEDDRNTHYLGREYLFYGRWDDCIRTLERHLSLPTAVWADERCASMRFLARAWRQKGRPEQARRWLWRAIGEAPHLREPYLELARLLYEEAEWDGVVYLCRQALAITDRPQTYICEAEAWGSLPWDLLSLGLYHTGRRGEALEAARQALALSPEDGRIRDNVAFLAG